MDAGTLSIRNIFGQDIRYVVPLFQRPYVWDRERQWEPFWDDVRMVAERVERKEPVVAHFFGAMVLEQVSNPTGHLETRWIIDGQQRLTTLQLLMEAFADICEELEKEKLGKALRKLTRNDDPMSTDPDEELKVWPTNSDQDHFRRVMQASGPSDVKESYGRPAGASSVGHQIADAYLYFHAQILEWLQADDAVSDDRFTALYTAIREHVKLVVIDLGGDDDPQMIFETLNARGTPLLPSDLVKNYLFHRAKLENVPLDPLYDQYWRPFDEDANYWRQELGRGHARRARIDLYLQYYLTAKTATEIPVGRLYASFQDYASDGPQDGVQPLLESLNDYASIYRSFDNFDPDTRIGLFFERLSIMGAMTAYPFLLELFARHGDDEKELIRVLEDVESFLLRRMVSQMNTRGYNRLFIELVDRLKDEGGSPTERVRTYLLEGDSENRRWPRDAEFKREWTNQPLYNRLAQARLRMIFEGLERTLHTGMTEKISFNQKLTIEHLMPRSWHEHWPLPGTSSQEEERSQREVLLHTIGNLTLVTDKLNPSLSNGPWPAKREKILKHSALNLNRPLAKLDEWTEEKIMARSADLFDAARTIWPCPE